MGIQYSVKTGETTIIDDPINIEEEVIIDIPKTQLEVLQETVDALVLSLLEV